MTSNKLTDEELEDLLSELEACGIYGRQVRALAELQERRKADPLNEDERKELARLRHEDGLRRQLWAQQMQHDPTLGGILPKR